MIRLLVIDDSALVRRLLGEVFSDTEAYEVAFARNGVEALARLADFRPDVITLDIQMPQMDGLTCLDRIMVERPTPVVIFSSLASEGAAETVEALALGAVDAIEKPAGPLSLQIEALAPLMEAKVRAAASARIRRTHRLRDRVRRLTGDAAPAPARRRRAERPAAAPAIPAEAAPEARRSDRRGLVLVGCSTGGPPALDALLEPLPAAFPQPILVAQHMPASFTGALARRLDKLCRLEVIEVGKPTALQAGRVYIGRGDADLIVAARPQGLVALAAPASEAFRWHPSVDRLVETAMDCVPAEQLTGVLMTGMGVDGAVAMSRLHAAGGRTLAEAEETAVVWGMPGELVRLGGAGAVAPLDALAGLLMAEAGR